MGRNDVVLSELNIIIIIIILERERERVSVMDSCYYIFLFINKCRCVNPWLSFIFVGGGD